LLNSLLRVQRRESHDTRIGRIRDEDVALPVPSHTARQVERRHIDADGNVYVADGGNHRIQKFDNHGKFVMEFGSNGSQPGQFQEPWGVAVDRKGDIYVADTWNHRIQKFTSNGELLLQWGTFIDTQGVLSDEQAGAFWGPRSVAFDSKGNVYVSDTGNKRVQVFDPEGNFLRQIGGVGAAAGQFEEPGGVAIDKYDNLFVADTWNRRIQKFNAKLEYVSEWSIEGWESSPSSINLTSP